MYPLACVRAVVLCEGASACVFFRQKLELLANRVDVADSRQFVHVLGWEEKDRCSTDTATVAFTWHCLTPAWLVAFFAPRKPRVYTLGFLCHIDLSGPGSSPI